MRKKMMIVSALFLCLLSFALSGCDKYVSSCSVMACVQTNTSSKASVSFSKLTGKMVYKLKTDTTKVIHYTGELNSGSITVYYDTDGTKKEMFTIKAGENVDATLGSLQKGTTYVILETNEKSSNGSFCFEVESSGSAESENDD